MKIEDLDDIASCVSRSSTVNVAQLVGSLNGTTFVPMYNWSEYFDDKTIKTALKSITQMHYFRFHSSFPSTVFVKTSSTAEERAVKLLKDVTPEHQLQTSLPQSYHQRVCQLNASSIYKKK